MKPTFLSLAVQISGSEWRFDEGQAVLDLPSRFYVLVQRAPMFEERDALNVWLWPIYPTGNSLDAIRSDCIWPGS